VAAALGFSRRDWLSGSVMDLENDRTEPAAGTSRRTLVRTAANAAWAVPLVSVVTAAPAHAAISTHRSLTITSATYWWKELDDAWGVTPLITVHNNSNVATSGIEVTLTFPPSFVGTRLTPPRATILNGPGQGWVAATPAPAANGMSTVLFSRPAELDAFSSSTIGVWAPVENAFSLAWKAQSSDPVSVTATAAGFTAGVAVLTKVNSPIS
jgi:hypothetical protein